MLFFVPVLDIFLFHVMRDGAEEEEEEDGDEGSSSTRRGSRGIMGRIQDVLEWRRFGRSGGVFDEV